MLWTIIHTSSLHSCHGPGLLHHASFWVPDPALFGRLVRPWILPSRDRAGEGLLSYALLGAWDTGQPLQELPHSVSETRLSGNDTAVFTFEGSPNASPGAESSESRRRILVLVRAAAQCLAVSSWGDVFPFHSDPGFSAPDACSPASPSGVASSGFANRARLLGRLLPGGSSVVVRSLLSHRTGRPFSPPSGVPAVYRRV